MTSAPDIAAMIEAASERVLVTGGSGFIGRNVCRRLLNDGAAVRSLTRGTDQRAMDCFPEDVDVWRGDLTDSDSIGGLAFGADAVIHCAGALGRWETGRAELETVNVEGTANLLQAAATANVKRFIHLSAGGVTGPVKEGVADETTECRPSNAYERAKLLGERLALELGESLNVSVTVVRPTFTYGPGDGHKLPLFQAVRDGRFAFIGDGLSVNHPVYIDDVVNGVELARRKGEGGEVYIIGGPEPVTKRVLIETIAELLDVPVPKSHIPRVLAAAAAVAAETFGVLTGGRPFITRSRVSMMGDDYGYSIDKAVQSLGYQPQMDLREGLRETIADYRQRGWL